MARESIVDVAVTVLDGKDDGAQADWNFGQQPGDFIFELKRRNGRLAHRTARTLRAGMAFSAT